MHNATSLRKEISLCSRRNRNFPKEISSIMNRCRKERLFFEFQRNRWDWSKFYFLEKSLFGKRFQTHAVTLWFSLWIEPILVDINYRNAGWGKLHTKLELPHKRKVHYVSKHMTKYLVIMQQVIIFPYCGSLHA